MRFLSFILCISLLSGCQEDVFTPDSSWTRFIYETSDVGAVQISSESNPTVAFRNVYYNLQGEEGEIVVTRKESLNEFDFF